MTDFVATLKIISDKNLSYTIEENHIDKKYGKVNIIWFPTGHAIFSLDGHLLDVVKW